MITNKKVLKYLKNRKGLCVFCNKHPSWVCSTQDDYSLRYFLCDRHQHIKLNYHDLRILALNNGPTRAANKKEAER